MSRPLYTNNAATYLAFGITNTATTMQVSANAGSLFPNPTGGDYFYVSLISLSGPIIEIVKCTARSGDILTIERGQEGTSALYWNMGDNVQLRITAAGMNYIAGSTASTTLEQSFTATQGQTLFTLTNFDYAPGTNNLAVFVNGSKQVSGTNYTETNVNTVTFTTGLNVGDVVEFLSNLSVASGTIYATDINYNEGATGAVTRTLESKLQESVSVLDFGADPTGTSDSTTAIQAALNTGRSVYFPNGTYLTSTVNLLSNIKVYGESKGSVILTPNGSIPSNILLGFGAVSNTELCNITISDCFASYPSLAPISLSSSSSIYIHDIDIGTALTGIQMFSSTSCVLEDITIGSCSDYGIYSNYGIGNNFNRCSVEQTALYHCIQDNHGFQNKITNGNFRAAFIFGISLYNASETIVSGNTCSETTREAINLENTNDCIVSNNLCSWTAGSQDFGISLYGPAPSENSNFNSITGNRIIGAGKSGIALAEQCQFNIISNNTITNINTLNETNAAGILMYGAGSGNNTITGNTVWSDNGKLYYGINASGGFASILTNNFLNDYITEAIHNVDGSASQLNTTGYTTYTPVVTAGSGSITSYTATGNYYQLGYLVFFQATITITNNGSGATSLNVTIPSTTAITGTITGRNTTSGYSLQGIISGTTVSVFTSTNAYPAATGSTIYISGFYQRT